MLDDEEVRPLTSEEVERLLGSFFGTLVRCSTEQDVMAAAISMAAILIHANLDLKKLALPQFARLEKELGIAIAKALPQAKTGMRTKLNHAERILLLKSLIFSLFTLDTDVDSARDALDEILDDHDLWTRLRAGIDSVVKSSTANVGVIFGTRKQGPLS